jgi:hypothetical protein
MKKGGPAENRLPQELTVFAAPKSTKAGVFVHRAELRSSRWELIKAARVGRVMGHSPEASARQAEEQRRSAAALKKWNPSKKPGWLTETVCREKIQPRLAGITVPAIASASGLSQPYAAEIRAGRQRPHPRHWQTLTRLVGISGDECSGTAILRSHLAVRKRFIPAAGLASARAGSERQTADLTRYAELAIASTLRCAYPWRTI